MTNAPITSLQLSQTIPLEYAGMRLDQALALLFPEYSRSRLQTWLREQQITVNGQYLRARDKVWGTEEVKVLATLQSAELPWQAQPIDLAIIYEDAHLLVINKPAGLVVHPAAGNWEGTLINALLHHCPSLAHLPRAGLIHRLDKDTSGLLVIAKTLAAHTHLVQQLQARKMHREYEAVVSGIIISGGTVDAPIGRHPTQRKRMAVIATGKPAITHYRVAERFQAHTRIRVKLETGRTHQIRVHMAHLHFPIVGDAVYGGRLQLPKGASPALLEALRHFRRQALHAQHLGLAHPESGEWMEWSAPPPADMQALIQTLRTDKEETHA